MDTNAITTYRIPAGNVAGLEERVAKIAGRAARLAKRGILADTATIGLVKLGTETVKPRCKYCSAPQTSHLGDSGVQIGHPFRADGPERVYVLVQVTGEAPKLAGWTFVATLQHEDAGTLLRVVPTAALPEGTLDRFRHAAPACDHCQADRRRNDTFVIRSDAGGVVRQVGRNCLSAFLGGLSPAQAAALAEIQAAVGEACSEAALGGDRAEPTTSLETFLAYVATCTRLAGWTSRTVAREKGGQATADAAWTAMFPNLSLQSQQEWAAKVEDEKSDNDAAVAAGAIAFAEQHLTPDAPGLSDYEHNLRVSLLGGFVTFRLAGIVASLVRWFQRKVDSEAAAQPNKPASQHVGTVGKRDVFTACLRRIHHFDADWGTVHLYRFEDAVGNVLVWKTSTGDTQLIEGARYTIKGTVKKHDDYKGMKQTLLTRCVANEIPAPACGHTDCAANPEIAATCPSAVAQEVR